MVKYYAFWGRGDLKHYCAHASYWHMIGATGLKYLWPKRNQVGKLKPCGMCVFQENWPCLTTLPLLPASVTTSNESASRGARTSTTSCFDGGRIVTRMGEGSLVLMETTTNNTDSGGASIVNNGTGSSNTSTAGESNGGDGNGAERLYNCNLTCFFPQLSVCVGKPSHRMDWKFIARQW